MLLVCEFCNEVFESDRKKRFCTKKCQLSKRKTCKGCGNEYVCSNQGRSEYCGKKCHPQRQKQTKCYVCVWCANVFTKKHKGSRNDGKYCTRQCRFDYLEWRSETRRVQESGDRWKIGGYGERQCDLCCSLFQPVHPEQLFCSQKCRQHPDNRLRWIECRQCGKMHCGKGQPVCRACVRANRIESRRAIRKTRQRCKKYGVIYKPGINREAIFDKQGWICQLCGIECRRDGRWLEDDAPELDHVIPVSKGGHHVESNLMCLCRKCNQEKSDMILV